VELEEQDLLDQTAIVLGMDLEDVMGMEAEVEMEMVEVEAMVEEVEMGEEGDKEEMEMEVWVVMEVVMDKEPLVALEE